MASPISTKAFPLVSVIVPAYNYGHFIGETIASVRAQTYQNWECLVVDDGSTDNTREVVSKLINEDGRVRYFFQENQGLAAARNSGIAETKGEYLQFLDADDLIEPLKLEKHVAFLEQNSSIDIVYGNTRYFRSDNPSERLFSCWGATEPWMPEISESVDAVEALVKRVIVVHAPLLRRTVALDIGPFDVTMNACEDWHFWIRGAAQGKQFRYLDAEETLALIRWHPQSMSQNDRLMTTHVVGMRRKVSKLIDNPQTRKLNRRLAAEYLGYGGIREIEAGNLLRGIRHLLGAATMSTNVRGRCKWLLCALVAPIAPGKDLEKLVATPIRFLRVREDEVSTGSQ